MVVRRQGFWDRLRRKTRKSLARLVCKVMRPNMFRIDLVSAALPQD
jgi:hypothetical protein